MFIFLTAIIVYKIIDIWVYIAPWVAGKAIVSISLLLGVYGLINGAMMTIREINLDFGMKKPLRIVQLSDIHLGTIRENKFLESVVEKTNKLNPDVVFITGDLVDGSAPLHHGMIKAINKIESPIYYVLGNHEIYEGVDKILKIVGETKIKILRNKVVNFEGIQIIGIDYSEEKKYAKKIFDKILPGLKYNKKKPAVMLFHSPLPLKDLEKAGIDLHLAGHTHGGQIFPFHLFVRMAFRYIRGLHKRGKTWQFISTGTGTWGPPMRVGSRNEIVVINLK